MSRLLARRLRRHRHEPAMLFVSRTGAVTVTDWEELLVQVRRFGLGLFSLGLERGQVVGLIGAGAKESVIALLGCMLVGIAVADLGSGFDSEEVVSLARRANVRAIICGSREQAEPLVGYVRSECGERRLIGFGAASSISSVVPFGQICLKGAELLDREPMRVRNSIGDVDYDSLALLLPERRIRGESLPPLQPLLLDARERYGVALTQENVFSAAESFRKALSITATDRIVRMGQAMGLVELSLTCLSALLSGSSFICDAGDMSAQQRAYWAHPTILFVDSEELDTLYRDIDRELMVGSAWRRWLSSWARRVGNEAARRRVSKFENGVLLSCSLYVADALVLSEYRRLLGASVRRVVSRSAKTRRSTRWFFEAIGLSPLGLVGSPESSGIGLLELPEDPRPGSYGVAMPGVSVCLDESSHIMIRGPQISANALELQVSGWLPLGIAAEIDNEGTVWPERELGALDAPSLAVLPIAEDFSVR